MSVDQKKLIHETPWHTLIILDACRYDVFSQRYGNFLEGELTKVQSPASCTREWLKLTWTEDYQDITYLSCNMYMQSRNSNHEHQYEPRHKFKRIIDVWKDGLMPEHMEKYALTTRGRRVLHYNFPHIPYHGEVKTDNMAGYESNLDYILGYLQGFLHRLKGLTVVTSDHGEWISGHGILHPCGKTLTVLREVPWLFQAKPLIL